MRAVHLGLSGGLLVALAACGSGISVQSDWDPGVDFSAFNTFAVLDEATGGGGLDQLTQNRIKTSIGNTLTAKGWRQVDDPKAADAAVGWQVTTEERSSFQTVSTGWGNYGWGWNRGWHGSTMSMGMTTSRTTETRYEVGTLIIALVDVERDEMIFVGQGTKTLSGGNQTPEQAQARIDEAVAKILEDFPPGRD